MAADALKFVQAVEQFVANLRGLERGKAPDCLVDRLQTDGHGDEKKPGHVGTRTGGS